MDLKINIKDFANEIINTNLEDLSIEKKNEFIAKLVSFALYEYNKEDNIENIEEKQTIIKTKYNNDYLGLFDSYKIVLNDLQKFEGKTIELINTVFHETRHYFEFLKNPKNFDSNYNVDGDFILSNYILKNYYGLKKRDFDNIIKHNDKNYINMVIKPVSKYANIKYYLNESEINARNHTYKLLYEIIKLNYGNIDLKSILNNNFIIPLDNPNLMYFCKNFAKNFSNEYRDYQSVINAKNNKEIQDVYYQMAGKYRDELIKKKNNPLNIFSKIKKQNKKLCHYLLSKNGDNINMLITTLKYNYDDDIAHELLNNLINLDFVDYLVKIFIKDLIIYTNLELTKDEENKIAKIFAYKDKKTDFIEEQYYEIDNILNEKRKWNLIMNNINENPISIEHDCSIYLDDKKEHSL